MPGKWSVGLCDCFGDCGTYCLTCWCPCITFGRIAEITDRGYMLHAWDSVCFARVYRLQLVIFLYQMLLNAGTIQNPGSPFMDCCVHMCCESCALCQEYKELENHGFNMSKGWKGSNETVRRMEAPEKQGMEVLLDHE
ncbi:cell number regulator 11-like [Lolium perenne]|uniref:cell number regulator 11-like n=1 Tax=Lolium perenne TaxID=4522 RepID=UPI003A991A4E